jgi:DNA-directed RNA polymerase subunit RPC12/RpoP
MKTVRRYPCARCGIDRKPSRKTSVVCADCREVLTPQERKIWAMKKEAV